MKPVPTLLLDAPRPISGSRVSQAQRIAELSARLAGQEGVTLAMPEPFAPNSPPRTAHNEASRGAAPAELKAWRHFRTEWTALAVDQELANTLAQAPEQAGPLNSHRLLAQAMQHLHRQATGYLQHWMRHAETLLWLDNADRGPQATKPRGRNQTDQ